MRIKDCPEKNTCPAIDRIISTIKGIIKSIEYVSEQIDNSDFESELNNCVADLEAISDKYGEMEALRTANSNLREWGNELYDQCTELDSINNSLQRNISDLEREIEELKSQLS